MAAYRRAGVMLAGLTPVSSPPCCSASHTNSLQKYLWRDQYQCAQTRPHAHFFPPPDTGHTPALLNPTQLNPHCCACFWFANSCMLYTVLSAKCRSRNSHSSLANCLEDTLWIFCVLAVILYEEPSVSGKRSSQWMYGVRPAQSLSMCVCAAAAACSPSRERACTRAALFIQ